MRRVWCNSFKTKHFISLSVAAFSHHSQCQTDRGNVQSANCGKQFQSCFLCKAQNHWKGQWAGPPGAQVGSPFALFPDSCRFISGIPSSWLVHSSCSCCIVFSFLWSVWKEGLAVPRPEGSEPWAAQLGICRLPGSFQAVNPWHILHLTPFNPFPPGSLKEPVRGAGTLWNLNTKRQLRGSGEKMSLISKTPSHWASSIANILKQVKVQNGTSWWLQPSLHRRTVLNSVSTREISFSFTPIVAKKK